MTLRRPHDDAELTAEEIAVIRQVLVACSQVLSWASRQSDRELGKMLAEATRAADGGHSPGGLAYHVSLAIDYLDFAPAARSTR